MMFHNEIFGGAVGVGESEVTKAYLLEMFQNSHHFWGAEGGSKVTKAYLSETFRNSIILKGSERLLFHVGWGFMMFDYEINSWGASAVGGGVR